MTPAQEADIRTLRQARDALKTGNNLGGVALAKKLGISTRALRKKFTGESRIYERDLAVAREVLRVIK